MLKLARQIISWMWRRWDFLGPIYNKYRNLEGKELVFNEAAVEQAIRDYEPIVWSIVGEGHSVKSAILKFIATKFAPHRMTRAEEERVFVKGSGNSTGQDI
jgi:hypothetical protein